MSRVLVRRSRQSVADVIKWRPYISGIEVRVTGICAFPWHVEAPVEAPPNALLGASFKEEHTS